MKSIKLRTRKGDMSQRFVDNDGTNDLHEWISDKIPPMPEGQLCEEHEDKDASKGETKPLSAPAEDSYFIWRIEGNHVCYSYLCENCYNNLNLDESPNPETYPTTKEGYAIAPKHCS